MSGAGPEKGTDSVDPRTLTDAQIAERLPTTGLIIVIERNDRGSFRVSKNKLKVKSGESVLWRPKGTDVEIIFAAGFPFYGQRLHLVAGCIGGLRMPMVSVPTPFKYDALCLSDGSQAKSQDDNDPELIIDPIKL